MSPCVNESEEQLQPQGASTSKLVVSSESTPHQEKPRWSDEDDEDIMVSNGATTRTQQIDSMAKSKPPKDLYSMPASEQRKWKPQRPLDSTTVCLMNLRLNMTRKQLMQLVDRKGFEGKYNMIYLPFNKYEMKNKGYAFINLTNMVHAESFRNEFEGYKLESGNSDKICLVDPANVKGFDKVKEKFSDTHPVNNQHPSQRPVMFTGPSCDLKESGPKCWRLFGGSTMIGDH